MSELTLSLFSLVLVLYVCAYRIVTVSSNFDSFLIFLFISVGFSFFLLLIIFETVHLLVLLFFVALLFVCALVVIVIFRSPETA